MKIERLQEIITLTEDVTIKYNGASITVESYDEEEGTAHIYEKLQPSRQYIVAVKYLHEISKL